MERAKKTASATDIEMKTTLRYDLNLVQGVTNVIMEEGITVLVMGLHLKRGDSDSFLGNLTSGILAKTNITTFIYNSYQPLATIKRHLVIIPENAEYESGFSFWLAKIWNIAMNTGAKIIFYGSKQTINLIKDIHLKHPIEVEFKIFNTWDDFPTFSNQVKHDDNLLIVLSRKNLLSYKEYMDEIPLYLGRHYQGRNFLLVYPSQSDFMTDGKVDLTNPSLLKAIEKIDIIGKTVAGIFRKK